MIKIKTLHSMTPCQVDVPEGVRRSCLGAIYLRPNSVICVTEEEFAHIKSARKDLKKHYTIIKPPSAEQASKSVTPKKEAPKEESPKKELPKKESPKKEEKKAPKPAPKKQEAPKASKSKAPATKTVSKEVAEELKSESEKKKSSKDKE